MIEFSLLKYKELKHIIKMNHQEFINKCLEEHNKYRLLHGVKDLTNSTTLNRIAQKRAEELILKVQSHISPLSVNGETVSVSSEKGKTITLTGRELTKQWYDDIRKYDFIHYNDNSNAGRFTQLVWKSTEKVGFGIAIAGNKCVVVANYKPPGNVNGQYMLNVLPLVSNDSGSSNPGNEGDCYKTNVNGALDDAFVEGIRPFIDIIDNLRKYGLQQYVELPNVVVVGDQSSGKSSIIEVISGIQLPRGSGIVTRCPLELQLKKVPYQPWKATISYKIMSGEEMIKETLDPKDVERIVSEAQEHLCMSKKGVSKELITLRVESPAQNAPDLTMIDLPGIARTPIEDQPLDICDQIRKIIMDNVKGENTVILCVISGDLDIAVNESINIARKVDPNGVRTIGVITKPDVADLDHKMEVLKMMDNKKINLKKGFNLVKCRSSKQLKNKVPLADFLLDEMEFYENDEIYRDADQTRFGALNLSRKITEELVNVIKVNLPGLQKKIELILNESEEQLNRLPPSIPQTDQEKRSYMMKMASNLNEKIKAFLCDGVIKREKNYHHTWRLYFDTFRQALEVKVKAAYENEFSLDALSRSIIEHRSNEISGFLSYSLFKELMKTYVQSCKKYAYDLITTMSRVIKRNLEILLTASTSHLPYIESDLQKIFNSEFEKSVKMAAERVEFIFEEESLIFTLDSLFDKKWIKRNGKYEGATDHDNEERKEEDVQYEENEEQEEKATFTPVYSNSQRMLFNIRCYLKIVHTRLSDYVPMTVMQCLLVQHEDVLKDKILHYVTIFEINEKCKETPSIVDQRRRLTNKINCLKKGKHELENKYSILNYD